VTDLSHIADTLDVEEPPVAEDQQVEHAILAASEARGIELDPSYEHPGENNEKG
jgi:hypothetical protein